MDAVYFNEFDSFAADWLGALWPEATVDRRDVRNVQPADVADFRRCHFFGGIGGWQVALDLAGWPAERHVWTASCPCQPLSCAGKRGGEKDERHLWPELYRLVSECRPGIIFGEQVDSADGLEWLDGISLDLEELDYAVGACDLPAASVGAPQRRQRFFWVAFAYGIESPITPARQQQVHQSHDGTGRLADDARERLDWASIAGSRGRLATSGGGTLSRLELADSNGQRGERLPDGWAPETPWASALVHQCTDGNSRRLSPERGSFPLAHGIPRDLGRRFPELRGLAKRARANRVGRLKGYGNSIVPQVAAKFIRAFMEVQS